jgi:hypothetical protein
VPDECIEWWGAHQARGYGYVFCAFRRRMYQAHRMVYEECFGEIPAGHHVHHECRNTSCVNPAHLRAVEPEQHRLLHLLTACRRGHEMDEANTYVDQRGRRHCRQCRALAAQRLRDQRKVAA